jgi:hypothetical protein
MLVDQFSPKTSNSSEKQSGYIYRFLPQLETAGLDANTIIQKTLYFVKVIDFWIDSCTREENWQARLNILLETHDEYTIKGRPEIADEMLNQFYGLKKTWFTIAESWADITNDMLSNDAIIKWYRQEMLKQVRR